MLALPEYPFHEIAECFPLMTGAEFDALVKDISENGQREPGWMYQGRIIDGRNRYRASRVAGKPFMFREWDGNGSLVEFVTSLNFHRRHLTESQRAVAAAKLKSRFEAEAKARMVAGKRASDPVANLPQGKARDAAASEMNVSPRTVEAASKVLRDGVPDLVKAVEAGTVAVSAAAEVARMPKEEQQAVVDAGPTAIVKLASEQRAQRVEASRVIQDPPERPIEPDAEVAAANLFIKFNRTTVNLRRFLNDLDADQIQELAHTYQTKDRREAVRELKEIAKLLTRWIQILESRHA